LDGASDHVFILCTMPGFLPDAIMFGTRTEAHKLIGAGWGFLGRDVNVALIDRGPSAEWIKKRYGREPSGYQRDHHPHRIKRHNGSDQSCLSASDEGFLPDRCKLGFPLANGLINEYEPTDQEHLNISARSRRLSL
jgi:hypothetical protein